MKKYSIILALLFTSTIFSQSLTDTLILNLINEYRVENNLNTLEFTSLGYKAAKHHNNYLNNHPDVGIVHEENNNTPSQHGRLQKYLDSDNRIWLSAENLYAKYYIPSSFKLNAKRSASNNIANQTVNAWKQSPGHNENLLLKTATYVGIHTMITKNNILIVTYVTYSFS